MIRWSLQLGYITIPKSVNEERIIANADIFDFFTDAAAGKRTRAEIQKQADWIITDLELECTPRVRSQPLAQLARVAQCHL